MKALVTGATGFVGGHVAAALVTRGDEVVALARRADTHAALRAAGISPVPGSLDDETALAAALAGVDVVYHVAGLTSGTEKELFATNEGGTRRLLEAARRCAGASVPRFVYVSSQAALGPSPRGTPLAEDAPEKPVTGYGRSKLAGEMAVRGAKVPWTIVRPPSVYGPRDREFLQLFKVARLGLAPVFGDGSQELSLVYVEDLARAVVVAGVTPGAAGRTYHAAHTEITSSAGVARAAGRALGRDPLILPLPGVVAGPLVSAIGSVAGALGRRTVLNRDKMAEFLAPSWLLSSERAQRELGWRAAVGLSEGMRRTAAWYLGEGWL